MLLQLKGCKKCRGDLCSEEDNFGEYTYCLQCGWAKDKVVLTKEKVNVSNN